MLFGSLGVLSEFLTSSGLSGCNHIASRGSSVVEKPYINKLDNVDEMDKFLKRHKSLKLT